MSRVKALALEDEGRRNAALLVRLATDPPRYLNSVYLAVMIVQNGSAILVAILAESEFGSLGVTIASLVFTLLYFVFVEAMSKTFGVLHSDRVALALSPLVYFLGRLLALADPRADRPGERAAAGQGHQGRTRSSARKRSARWRRSAARKARSRRARSELIHSIFEFGDTIVREVMVPRPDIIAIEDDKALRDVQALVLTHGTSRIPVYDADEDLDDVVGIVFAKDVLKALHQGKHDMPARRGRARGATTCPSRRRSPTCCARCSARSSTWRS